MWAAVAATMVLVTGAPHNSLKSSWLRVHVAQSVGAPAVIRHAWVHTPPVDLVALFGTNRIAVSIGPHSLWYRYKINTDLVARAHTRGDLRHAVDVHLSQKQSYGTVAVSVDVADALREADRGELEARVRASVLKSGGACAARVGRDPSITRELASCVARQALARLGVF
jgi:hypothetical protein